MKYSILIIISIAILPFTSCNLDVNTSDPQESTSISQSKKSDLFISEYELKTIDSPIFKIKEAWMEKSWKWEVNYGIKERVETGRYQLNLLLDSFIDSNFKNNEYGIKWKMENKLNGYFRSTGNVYTLSIKQLILPDTLNISIEQINEDLTTKKFPSLIVKKK
jgi:hypothetical protein